MKFSIYRDMVKPLSDKVASLILLIILSPFLVLLLLLLTLANQGSPLFFQPRLGRHANVFKVVKFKTMNDNRDAHGNLLPDDERLTTVGKFIRKTSLDELPQLWNVLIGNMSLIGPRPLLLEYKNLYNPVQFRRHEATPGITGWAQVNGRNTISWKDKFEYDVWYVDHVTFALDLKILWITVQKVLRAEGISGKGVATAEKFNGKN